MKIYSIMIYSWPVSLIKLVEGWCRNFIWNVDISKWKLVTVAWKQCCKAVKDGELGMHSLKDLNDDTDLK